MGKPPGKPPAKPPGKLPGKPPARRTKAQLEVDVVLPSELQAMVESRRSATKLARFDAFVDRAKFPA
jgi:hypothetical protein